MDNQPAGGGPPAEKPAPPRSRIGTIGLLLLAIATLVLGVMVFTGDATKRSKIDYGFFRQQLKEGNVTELKIDGQKAYGKFKTIPKLPEPEADPETGEKRAAPPDLLQHFWTFIVPLAGENLDAEILNKVGANYSAAPISDGTALMLLFYVAITGLLLFGMWLMYRRARDQILGGGFLLVSSRARRNATKPARSGSPSTTWPAWKASSTNWRKSSSSSRTRRSSSGSAAACPRASC